MIVVNIAAAAKFAKFAKFSHESLACCRNRVLLGAYNDRVSAASGLGYSEERDRVE